MKVYGVTGWKNTGKTGLTERLVAEFVRRGLKVSTVKHAHHAFDIDHPGRDSYRHRGAGAAEVAVVSGSRMAVMTEFRGAPEPPMEDVIARLGPCDLVLVEGYKHGGHPKVETHRVEIDKPLIALTNPSVRAVASNGRPEAPVPLLDLDDTGAIADFIAAELGLGGG